jgi:hypothetical protein
VSDDRDVGRLRDGLRGLAGSDSTPLDTTALRFRVTERARRAQARRRVAGAVAVAVPFTAAGLWFLADRPLTDPGTVTPGSSPTATATLTATPSTSSPSPTESSLSSGPTAIAPPTVENTLNTSLRVSLVVRSGPKSQDGRYGATWEVSWSGGVWPVSQVLIEQDPARTVLADNTIQVRCDARPNPGSLRGDITFASPGPHELVAVVRAVSCTGRVDRQTDTDVWTWSGPTSS